MISRRAVSEFPNDNPELHDGLVWTCPELRGRALPTLRIRPLAGALPRVIGPSWWLETEPDGATDAPPVAVHTPRVAVPAPPGTVPAPPVTVPAPPVAVPAPPVTVPTPPVTVPTPPVAEASPALALPPDVPVVPASPFEVFMATVARVALNRGATRAAAAVTALLAHGRLAPNGVDPTLLAELIRRNVLASASGHASSAFAAATSAWRAVLDGSGGDLSGCGNTTLDAWAAELLAAVTNAPRAEVPEFKRELRRAGVAAFGLLAVA